MNNNDFIDPTTDEMLNSQAMKRLDKKLGERPDLVRKLVKGELDMMKVTTVTNDCQATISWHIIEKETND